VALPRRRYSPRESCRPR